MGQAANVSTEGADLQEFAGAVADMMHAAYMSFTGPGKGHLRLIGDASEARPYVREDGSLVIPASYAEFIIEANLELLENLPPDVTDAQMDLIASMLEAAFDSYQQQHG